MQTGQWLVTVIVSAIVGAATAVWMTATGRERGSPHAGARAPPTTRRSRS